jgi:hypothetical protein
MDFFDFFSPYFSQDKKMQTQMLSTSSLYLLSVSLLIFGYTELPDAKPITDHIVEPCFFRDESAGSVQHPGFR